MAKRYKLILPDRIEYIIIPSDEDAWEYVMNIYEVTTEQFTLVEADCHGCNIDSLSQYDHMDHPFGCLHDSSFCDECTDEIMEENETLLID